jgi:predicted ATPase
MNNCTTLASMQLLNMAFLYTYLGQMDLCPLISCKIVEMTVDHGLCAVSAVGFSAFGLVVSGIGGLIEEGERYGQLALRMCDQI